MTANTTTTINNFIFFIMDGKIKHMYVKKQSIIRLDNVFQIQFNVVRICIEFNLYICRDELIIYYIVTISKQRLAAAKKRCSTQSSLPRYMVHTFEKRNCHYYIRYRYNHTFPTTLNIHAKTKT